MEYYVNLEEHSRQSFEVCDYNSAYQSVRHDDNSDDDEEFYNENVGAGSDGRMTKYI